jgi:MerR HTH family regulatory protein
MTPQGPTARQLDYWVQQGWLHPETRSGRQGSGHWWRWTEDECRVAEMMSRLVKVGLAPPVAAKVARAATKWEPGGVAVVNIAKGVSVMVDV